jgi:FAD/FMN-containing dehydrogenase
VRKKGFTRRRWLQGLGTAIFAPSLLVGARASRGAALPQLPNLSADDALLLGPADPRFEQYEVAYNRRTMIEPQLRTLTKTPAAVAAMVDWVRTNRLPFALRSGGHSYEGLSQSQGVVIDTRLMNGISLDVGNRTVTVGAGTSLGDLYKFIGQRGFALPAGSCPTVGIAGHSLGGGYGLLARPFGLSCDSLLSVELVDPQARLIVCDRKQSADLFWACRGGGGGTFGAATSFRFRVQPLRRVVVFSVSFVVAPDRAAKLFEAWQRWAPHAPDAITSILKISKLSDETIAVHCAGQSVGLMSEVRNELKALLGVEEPVRPPDIRARSFLQAVDHFSGGWDYESKYSKGKSDFILSPLGDDGIAALIDAVRRLPANEMVAICDAYGGAIARPAPSDTAFVRRAGALYCIQYYSSWEQSSETAQRVHDARIAYNAMRPYVSGAAYVNYCDLDLTDWAEAYWGPNLPRLRQIKSAFDPDNVFRHAQSIGD